MQSIIQAIVNVINLILEKLYIVIDKLENAITRVLKFLFGFLTPLGQLFKPLLKLLKESARLILVLFCCMLPLIAITVIGGKVYQGWDKDPTRGAIAVDTESMGEKFTTPVYTDQNWSKADSLWFYNTTQGSDLMPYDFFVELEQADSREKFISPANIDLFRYLPQKATFFNPDALPVGFVKDTYQDFDYVGLTCAACHTGQVNYNGNAVRVDGAPATADMDLFLGALHGAMQATGKDAAKKERFIDAVLKRNTWKRGIFSGEGYSSREQVSKDLEVWTNRLRIYNVLNYSKLNYGYARLDAFGRIFNRVLQHTLEKDQIANRFAFVHYPDGKRVLSNQQISLVLEGMDDLVIGEKGFEKIIERLQSKQAGYPGLDLDALILVRDAIFNPANAPVSYPFLWDIAQSDYVQWNGLAENAGIGPLGRNTGEVIGVFGTLDWKKQNLRWWEKISLSAEISGQSVKSEKIDFKSSIDKVNLTRIESHLKSLESPRWTDVKFKDGTGLPPIDKKKWVRGRQLYAEYCVSCHEIIQPDNWERKVIAKMLSVDKAGTDPKMALNSVSYTGPSGNFKHIYQDTGVGPVIVEDEAPVVQILTAATRGVIATPDADKWVLRRFADWIYTLVASISDNPLKPSIKAGEYTADTTDNPYASLLAYKARSLNGIWATAPYLHNGSVPTLYDLLLPKRTAGDPPGGEYRPDTFGVGCRDLDAAKVGIDCPVGKGQLFRTTNNGQPILGNSNAGHEYAAGKTPPMGSDEPLPALGRADRMALVEYIKSL